MFRLAINIITWAPDGVTTYLESMDTMIPSIARAYGSLGDRGKSNLDLVINIMVNSQFKESTLRTYLNSHFKSESEGFRIAIFSQDPNTLMSARNALIKKAALDDRWIWQMDDDDRITEDSIKSIYAYHIAGALSDSHLNFFYAHWLNRSYQGEVEIIPHWKSDIDLRSVLKPYFSFSDWNWIAYAPWLVDSSILYFEDVNDSHLCDNYFHCRSALFQKEVRLFTNVIYEWINRPKSMSTARSSVNQSLLEYLKQGRVGYEVIAAYGITEGSIHPVYNAEFMNSSVLKDPSTGLVLHPYLGYLKPSEVKKPVISLGDAFKTYHSFQLIFTSRNPIACNEFQKAVEMYLAGDKSVSRIPVVNIFSSTSNE